MTSKEALNQLYILADTPELAMVIQSYYDIVEKDLKVLKILKKFSIELCNCFSYTSLTNEEFELLKEWVEDGK